MKLFLHIGTEKTGSSFLQTLLALNREQLRTFKFFYPTAGKREEDMLTGKISPGNGKTLCLALQEKNINHVKSILLGYKKIAAKADCDVILLSNENLIEPLSQKDIYDIFINICNELSIDWTSTLLILRDPIEQALSLYKHRAKNGRTPDLNDWLEEGYKLPTILNDILTLIDVNKIRFTIRKYQKDAVIMQQIMFEDWLNIGTPAITYNKSVNPSLTISELLLLKKIGEKNRQWVNPFYQKMLNIPFKDKDKEQQLSSYYKRIINTKLLTFNEIWKKCNDHLSNEEKLDTVSFENYDQTSHEVLSFSKIQIEQIVTFLLEVKNEPITIKKLLKTIKNKLASFSKH